MFNTGKDAPHCNVCLDLNRGAWEEKERNLFSYSKTKISAKDGCRICSCICEVLEHYFHFDKRSLTHLQDKIEVGFRLEHNLILRPRGFNGLGIMLYAGPGDTSAWGSLTHAREICSIAGSDECLGLAKQWMSECLASHEKCQLPTMPGVPKRIVDIGSTNQMMLLETANFSSPYAALSHCWGKHRPLETTKSTLDLRKQKLEWESMPATFQDAIEVTRNLGLRYLWIDSLCIIQDDEHDWASESVKMGSIYEGAQVVIAASSSPDGTHSFLGSRETDYANPLELNFDRADGTRCVVKARPVVRTDRFLDPLDTRAWTWQEHRLAVRLLRFTGAELVWNCRTTMKCECESIHDMAIVKMEDTLVGGRYCTAVSDLSAGSPFVQWQGMVRSYTGRQLTRKSDKLPAISGIAALIQQATGSEYLAGLWGDNLVMDLAWQTSQSLLVDSYMQPMEDVSFGSLRFSHLRAMSTYRAPTFSWASIDGEAVEFRRHHRSDIQIDAVVFDAHCTLKGDNPLGEVTGGFIVLRAPVISAEVTVADNDDGKIGMYYVRRNAMKGLMHADLPLVEGLGLTSSAERERTFRRASVGDVLRDIKGSVFCLLLWHTENSMMMLVLGRSPTIRGAYERLGIMDYVHQDRPLEWFVGARQEDVRIV